MTSAEDYEWAIGEALAEDNQRAVTPTPTPKRPPWRCRHGWHGYWIKRDGVWLCPRCEQPYRRCMNCGGQHNPHAFITVCTVTRSVER